MLDTKALVAALAPVIREAQAPLLARIAALENRAPEKGDPGKPGEPGKNGADGHDGEPGEAGKDGKDGVGLSGALIDRAGALVLTLSDGTTRDLGVVVGRDGRDGVDGEKGDAGFGLEDFDVTLAADGRTVELTFGLGERRIVRSLEIPTMIYRGVFNERQAYTRGDTVTWGGSLWHCDAATSEKPGDGSKAWTLAAKRGRDGKDFAGPQTKTPAKVTI